MKTQTFEIVKAQSHIDWTGRKVTGAHNGRIAIKEGLLITEEGKLSGGKFVIDTKSITILDVTDPATNTQFAGHLASDDFFSSEKFPEALFEIVSATHQSGTNYHVEGHLTIKGITHPLAFDAEVNVDGNTIHASGKMVVDRTKYNMKFRSGNFFKDLGDTLIYNEFDLQVIITAKISLS
jgi:polyisoprenoid-binding protein YceI